MKNYRQSPTVNAGSMADIAFLLLLFFLVSTTIAKDKGILRKLPENCPPGQICDRDVNERNVLRIQVNEMGELYVNNKRIDFSELKTSVKDFVDNNGDKSCGYCQGEQITLASDNPKKATIAIDVNSKTPYKYFISVQDELTKAYYELREDYAGKVFNKTSFQLTTDEVEMVKAAYPFRISEAAVK